MLQRHAGNEIAIGTLSGSIQIWDTTKNVKTRELLSHTNRVGTLAWSSSLLASGSRDRSILLHDVRLRGGGSNSSTPGRGDLGSGFGPISVGDSHLSAGVSHESPAATTAAALAAALTNASSLTSFTFSPSRRGSFIGTTSRQTLVDSSSAALHSPGSEIDSTSSHLVFEQQQQQQQHNHIPGSIVFPTSPPYSPSARIVNSSTSSSLLSSPPRAAFLNVFGSPQNSLQRPTAASSSGPTVFELNSHQQEVCGLKWSSDERMLASGGNDNVLCIWNPGYGNSHSSSAGNSTPATNSHGRRVIEPLCKFTDHIAAVKAVAWSPHQHGLVASGGGTADRHIRFWNALTSTALHKIDTGSQVRHSVT